MPKAKLSVSRAVLLALDAGTIPPRIGLGFGIAIGLPSDDAASWSLSRSVAIPGCVFPGPAVLLPTEPPDDCRSIARERGAVRRFPLAATAALFPDWLADPDTQSGALHKGQPGAIEPSRTPSSGLFPSRASMLRPAKRAASAHACAAPLRSSCSCTISDTVSCSNRESCLKPR